MSLNLVIINKSKEYQQLGVVLALQKKKALKLRDDIYLVEGEYSSLDILLTSGQDKVKVDIGVGFQICSLSAFCGNVDAPQPEVSKLCARHLKSELLYLSEKI